MLTPPVFLEFWRNFNEGTSLAMLFLFTAFWLLKAIAKIQEIIGMAKSFLGQSSYLADYCMPLGISMDRNMAYYMNYIPTYF